MSFSLLIALFVAFGFDTPTGPGALPRSEIAPRVLEVLGGLAVVGVVAFGLGRLVAIRVAHRGRVTPAIRRFHALNRRIVMILTLAFYGWVIYQVGWPRVIRSGLGLGDTVLVDEALILLPFLLAQGLVLWGFFAAERALRPLEAAVRADRPAPLPGAEARGSRWGWCSRWRRSSRWGRTSSAGSGRRRPRGPGRTRSGWPPWERSSWCCRRRSSGWRGRHARCPPARCATDWSGWRTGSGSAAPTSWSGTREGP